MGVEESYEKIKKWSTDLVNWYTERGLDISEIKKCFGVIETERKNFEEEFPDPFYRAVIRGHVTGLGIEIMVRYDEQ